ncbi:MAG: hypothetical protein SPK09_02415 [Porphyromonas sp.]|nr:hypothetical protein [Porphyromonas sp.]
MKAQNKTTLPRLLYYKECLILLGEEGTALYRLQPNYKEAIRQIARAINLGYNENWTQRQFYIKLIQRLNRLQADGKDTRCRDLVDDKTLAVYEGYVISLRGKSFVEVYLQGNRIKFINHL